MRAAALAIGLFLFAGALPASLSRGEKAHAQAPAEDPATTAGTAEALPEGNESPSDDDVLIDEETGARYRLARPESTTAQGRWPVPRGIVFGAGGLLVLLAAWALGRRLRAGRSE